MECAFLGKSHRLEHDGPFARIGNDPRCELCIPGLPASVCVYLQIGKNYVAVLELVDSEPVSVCEPIYALPGGTIWLQPNARITVESITGSENRGDQFSWENFNVEDVRVFPNTLVARSGFFASSSGSPNLRIESTLSVLGASTSCQLRPEHKHVSRFQAVIFRGEHQGESCRVVDLFGAYPTLVDNQPANGQVLEVGSQLSIANLNFEAVRFLYNASRPSRQIVEVRSQFTTLPLATKQNSAGTQGTDAKSTDNSKPPTGPALPDLHSMKERLARAIGFDSGPSPNKKIHFSVAPDSDSQTKPQTQDSPANKSIVEGLERVAKSQERIADQFEKLTARLDKVERSLETLPEILDENTQSVADSIESLKVIFQSTPPRPRPEEWVAATQTSTPEVSNKPTVGKGGPPTGANLKPVREPTGIQSSATQSSATHSSGIQQPKRPKETKGGKSNVSPKKPLPSPKPPTASTKQIESNESDAKTLSERRSWVERATMGLSSWIANNNARRRAIAEREDPNDPLNLGSQATAKRTRLQPHEDESELLAASESEDEALVLGSLMGLRYRDAKKSFIKWALFTAALLTTVIVGGPIIWKKIPDGWRELLWQKITFAKTPQEIEYEANFGNPPAVPEAPPEPTEFKPEETAEKLPPEQPSEPSEPAISTDPAASDPPSD